MFYWLKHILEKRQWYRKWKGGKWSYQFIDVCRSCIWFDTWERQPCCTSIERLERWPNNRVTVCECCGYIKAHRYIFVRTSAYWGFTTASDDTAYLDEKGQMLCGGCRQALKALDSVEW